jgi:hypothetical protein
MKTVFLSTANSWPERFSSRFDSLPIGWPKYGDEASDNGKDS